MSYELIKYFTRMPTHQDTSGKCPIYSLRERRNQVKVKTKHNQFIFRPPCLRVLTVKSHLVRPSVFNPQFWQALTIASLLLIRLI